MTGTEPIPLVVQGKEQIAAFVCGKCHTVASSPVQFGGTEEATVEAARREARLHCGPWFCACGTEVERYRTKCGPCWTAEAAEQNAQRTDEALAKAKRVTLDEYTGEMVYDESKEAYLSLDDIEDRRSDGDLPEYVWGCYEKCLSLSAGDIIEGAIESGEHHEEAAESLARGAETALQEAIDKWAGEYARGVRTFYPDYGVVIFLDETPESRGTDGG